MIINILNISIPLEALIPLIFIIFLLVSAVVVFLKNSAKKMEEKIERLIQKVIFALNFQNIQKVSSTKFKGVYMNREVMLEYTFSGSELPYLNVNIQFPDSTEPKSITQAYFSLSNKIFNSKWNGFENTFNLTGSKIPLFDAEIKSNLEYLYGKGYFTQFTILSAWPPNRNRGFGNMIFELPWDIIEKEDTESLRKVIDIIFKIADQMMRK